MHLLLELLLGAGLWNFLLMTTAPQRIPQTTRACILLAGLEGGAVGCILLVIQAWTDYPGEIALIFNSARYGIAWAMFSMVMKNQYRRLKQQTSALQEGRMTCDDDDV